MIQLLDRSNPTTIRRATSLHHIAHPSIDPLSSLNRQRPLERYLASSRGLDAIRQREAEVFHRVV